MKIPEFQKNRFGLFIHFGAYAVNGKSEWLKSHEKMTDEAYQVYIDAFSPERIACRSGRDLLS